MDSLIALATDPAAWAALATLIAMEVVLGIDNLIFISILTNKLPEHQRVRARRIGIGLALILRLALLGTVAVIVQLTEPIFEALRPRLLLARPDPDRRRPVPGLEGDQGDPPQRRPRPRPDLFEPAATMGFGAAIGQILAARPRVLDRQHHHRGRHDRRTFRSWSSRWSSRSASCCWRRPRSRTSSTPIPTIVMLALGFLLLIGTMLIADGFGVHVPRGLHLHRDGVLGPDRGPQHAVPPCPPQTRRSESVGHQGEDLTAARSVNAAHLARLRQCEAVLKALTTIRDAATTARGLAIASRSRAIGWPRAQLSCGNAQAPACKPEGSPTLLWRAKGISAKIEPDRREDRPMDFKDQRIWYAVAAVIVVLIIIGYATGWFSGAPAPPPQQ